MNDHLRDQVRPDRTHYSDGLRPGRSSRLNGAGPRLVRRSPSARTRSANQMPLNAALHNLLKGKTMSVSEAADAVQKAGYKSNSANFYTVVNLTLLKRKDLFKRVERGQYTATWSGSLLRRS